MSFNQIYLKPGVNLFDNQKHNVSCLVHRRKALLTDRVGSGKSLSTLYAFAYLKEKQKLKNMLVLTPLSAYTKEVWKKDIQKFTMLRCIDLDTLHKRLEGRFDKIELILNQYDIVYGKHSHVKQCLSTVQLLCSQPDMLLVCDEVHAFKNPKSLLTISFRKCSSLTKNFWGITGTSLSKNMEDVYNIVNLVSPWYLGPFISFRETYCETREKVIGRVGGRVKKTLEIVGVRNEEEFKKKLEPLVITGTSFAQLNFNYVDYNLSKEESNLYKKVANGITLSETMSAEEWIQYLVSNPVEEVNTRPVKEFERYSSRFIYLQTAADGVLTDRGTQDNTVSTKIDKLVDLVKEITGKKQSVLIYFDFLASLESVEKRLKEEINAVILKSTGENVLKDSDVTEAKCKLRPHVILCTRAAAESVSYYFINNVVFFHIPTVPHTMVQFAGRITRKNTLYPDDLQCYIFRSMNIDLYKLLVVSSKAYQMEVVQGEEKNIPPDYKAAVRKSKMLDNMKKILLWQS